MRRCIARKISSEKHADLPKWVLRSIQGDPRGLVDDHEPAVAVAADAMRWKTL
jgi:hypothetical protein